VSTQKQAPRLDHLDGLRALAATWVMLGHCQLFAYGWTPHEGIARPLNILLYLHLPVDIFIVPSGFCLALPCVHRGEHLPGTLGDYFRARAARILPPAACAVGYVLHRYAIHGAETVNRFNNHLALIDSLVGVLTALALVALSLPNRLSVGVRRVLEWRPLVGLGHASYSLYLIHLPILSVVYRGIEVMPRLDSPAARFAWLVAIGGGGGVLLALGFAAVFERKATAYFKGARKVSAEGIRGA